MPAGTLIALMNGDEQVSINLSGDTDAKPTRGYHLVTYQANPAPAELARNSSLYIDGNTPVFSKAGNTVETIKINIKGTDAPDAYDLLRALQRWAYWVRDYHAAPNSRWPSYMSYSPWGVSGRYYAVLINAQVNESDQSGRANTDAGWIKNVTITIERESFWREQVPNSSAFANAYNFISGGTTAAISTVRPWGVLPFNGLAGGIEVPAGDVPAMVWLSVTPATFGPIANAVFGYVSQRRNGIPGYTIPTAPIVHEIENFSIIDATHCAAVSRSSASPYTAFGTMSAMAVTTSSPLANRVLASIGMGTQRQRMFLRMKVATAGLGTTVQVRLSQTGIGFIGPAVNVDSTVSGADWRMYDMGVIEPPLDVPTTWIGGAPLGQTIQIVIATAHLAGTGTLEMDCIIAIPCDEYFVEMSIPAQATSTSAPAVSLNNIMLPIQTIGNVNGTLYIPPGKGVLYYLTGYDNFGNFWDGVPTPAAVATINLVANDRYGSIKGN